ncbi:hypothetical protein DFH06DRAFT_1473762 [Mycena polygramma]|nr:hypothetical protein DFH06DRAFT_1473762 [Mycena polygramma]
MACWNCGAASGCDNSPLMPSISSIQHLMRSNNPPSDVEIPVLHNFTANARRRVEALDGRIGILKAAMERLTSERDNLAGQVEQCRHVLSPIRRVPPELICEIFSWTLPCTRSVADSTVTHAPWYLGHISRPWRETALGFPSLWTSISIFHARKYPHEKVSPLAMVETQLIRSSNAPLGVDITWLVEIPSDAIPLLEAILSHSNRWESFRLCAEDSRTFLELLRPAKGNLLQLCTLEIIVRGGQDESSEALDIFTIAPRLREVLLTTPSCGNYSPLVLLPTEHLTRYRAVGTAGWFLGVLREAPNLVESALGFIGQMAVVGDAPLTIPNLRRLYVEQGGFLAHLTTPALEYLSCDAEDLMLPFFRRSCRHLTTLVLTEAHSLPGADVAALLQNTPSLKDLVLHAYDFEADNNYILSALTVSGSPEDICPNLLFLGYGGWTDPDGFSSTAFLAMIRSRLQPERSCRLSALRLIGCTYDDAEWSDDQGLNLEEWTPLMQVLIDEGLDVEFRDDSSRFLDKARYSFIVARW